MLPLIIVAKSKTVVESFLQDYTKRYKFTANRIYKIFPRKNEISIQQIREIKKELKIQSPGTRLFIFFDFQHSSQEAQNAFLKSLEEQSTNNQFVLIADNEHALLPTIRSRAKIVKLNGKATEDKAVAESSAKVLDSAEKSMDYSFLASANVLKLSREDIANFMDQTIIYYRKKLIEFPSQSSKIIKKAMQIKALVENNNINSQLAIDNLLIFIKKTFKMRIES